MGCFGISIPERFGGIQSDEHEDNLGMIVVTEELTRGSLGAAGSLITRPEILSKALLKGGTEEQKLKWLPQLASGDLLCAVAVTEPNYGSDVANMRLKATKTEGGWLLNGAKTWCTFGGKAGVLLILARTNPDISLGHRGLSMFLLEKPSYPGHAFEFKQEGGGKLSGKAIPPSAIAGCTPSICSSTTSSSRTRTCWAGRRRGQGFLFHHGRFFRRAHSDRRPRHRHHAGGL
jgi:(2S)-methylsuccinyl-CoA dehydrogenase